ncbi:hypothetical protein, partial [Enterococcus faecium]
AHKQIPGYESGSTPGHAMFLYVPFLLAFLTVVGIALGWKSLSNKLWLASTIVTLWWFSQTAQPPLGFIL